MISSLSNQIVNKWITEGIISPDHVESYKYGLELLLSSLINLTIMLLISAFFHQVNKLWLYLLSFIPLRMFAGGYHANSHLCCTILNSFLYLIALIIFEWFPLKYISISLLIMSLSSLIIVSIFSPVQSPNKPLSDSEQLLYRRISLIISIAIVVLCGCITVFFITFIKWAEMIVLGELCTVFLLIIAEL